MATKEEVRALLSIPCPWCGARIGERCRVPGMKRTVAVSTLDGECHDARWQAALRRPALVLAASARPMERPW